LLFQDSAFTFNLNRYILAEFLDRLFNTLNWTITEFSVAMKVGLDTTFSPRYFAVKTRFN
jgi:hypothetical protein